MKRKSLNSSNTDSTSRTSSISSTSCTSSISSTSCTSSTNTGRSTRKTRNVNPIYESTSPAEENTPPDTVVEDVSLKSDPSFKEADEDEDEDEDEEQIQVSKPDIPQHWPADEDFPAGVPDVPAKWRNLPREDLMYKKKVPTPTVPVVTGYYWMLKANNMVYQRQRRICPRDRDPSAALPTINSTDRSRIVSTFILFFFKISF